MMLSLTNAAALIPGATPDTLKRHARAGRLTVYRTGKAYTTTDAAMAELIEKCRVVQKDPAYGSVKSARRALPHGSSSTIHASTALDSALARARQTKKKR